MAGFGSADVVRVSDAHAVPEIFELSGDLIGELLGGDAGGGGGALDLLAVLVGAGEEEGIVAEEAVAAGEDVRNDGGVGVADVGARVDVIDRRGEVELLWWLRHRKSQFTTTRRANSGFAGTAHTANCDFAANMTGSSGLHEMIAS